MRHMCCKACGFLISKKRLEVIPDATTCASCLQSSGDVPRVRGLMVWNHKTAPTLQLLTPNQAADVARFSRKGVHAQLPMANKAAEFGITTSSNMGMPGLPVDNNHNFNYATCHPDRVRVSPMGHCMECSLKWYESWNKLQEAIKKQDPQS